MSWEEGFKLLMSAFGAVGLWALRDAVSQLRAMKESMSKLNEKLAVVIQITDSHEKRIEKLEDKEIN